MKSSYLLLLTLFSTCLFSQSFQPRGTGGGGALFNPSINPNKPTEIYLASDLGGLYHSDVNGFEVDHYQEAIAGSMGKVCFTFEDFVRYALLYDAANFVMRPAKSVDHGQTWDFLPGDDQPWEDKLFIFNDFQSTNRLVWTDYNHIFFSNDGGQTATEIWAAADPGTGILLSGVFFDFDNIWLGTNEGVIHSSDGGASFAKANFTGIPAGEAIIGFGGGKISNTIRFFALTGDPGNVWATNMGYNYWQTVRGVYTMDNLSNNWVPKMNGIDIDKDFVVWLAMAENDISTCYLAGSTEFETPIVLKTSNGGESWEHVFLTENNQNIRTGYAGDGGDFGWSWAGFPLGFSVNLLFSEQAILTDFGFVHSTKDGGLTWSQGYTNPQFEHSAGAETPKKQLYSSIGLEQTTCWQVYWFDQDNLFACYTDIRGMRSEDGGATWSFDYTGHDQNTMYRIAKHNTQEQWFAATSSVHDIYQTTYVTDARLQPSYKAGKVIFTQDKGKTWQTMRDFGNPVIWVTTDGSNNDRLYAGVISTDPSKGGVWRADGIGNPASATWTKLPNPAANNGRIFNIHSLNDGTLVTTWSARKGNNNSVFSDSSGVFVSVDGGQNWERRNHPDMNYWTKDLVIDPNDPTQSTWYACVWSGWGGPANDLGGLFRTTDRGLNWEKITADGQFHRVSSVAFIPFGGTYLTTEGQGLWKTESNISSGQPTWELVEDYPFWHPERVFQSPYEPDLWIASFGNGMSTAALIEAGSNEKEPTSSTMKVLNNPASNVIKIEFFLEKPETTRFSLVDLQGRNVKDFGQKQLPQGKQLLQFEVQGMTSGNYFIQAVSGNVVTIQKVILH